jgi:hypothetical protein
MGSLVFLLEEVQEEEPAGKSRKNLEDTVMSSMGRHNLLKSL